MMLKGKSENKPFCFATNSAQMLLQIEVPHSKIILKKREKYPEMSEKTSKKTC